MLVVSYTFPPDASVGGLRIARLCRYMPEHGIEPIVLSVETRFYESLDHTFPVPEQMAVVRTGSMRTPVDWYRYLKGRLVTAATAEEHGVSQDGLGKSFFRRHILALVNLPDEHWGWYFPALKGTEKLIKPENISLIFSSGPPWVSHLIARRLKARYRLPWIADFRDPWAHFLPEKKRPQWRQHFLERLEERCIHSADLIVCNTERMRQSLQSHYADLDPSKFRTLPNGYDDVEAPANLEKDPKRVFLHLGSIYGLRRIDTFLQAITELIRCGRLNPNSFRLVFQGEVSPEFLAAAQRDFRDLMIRGCLEFRPRVSWRDAQSLLWSADRLLLFQGHHALQVPAKFYEYLQTGIPIFAVTEEGALTDLLTSTGAGFWAKPGDPKQIAERFMQVLELPRHGPDSVQPNLLPKFHFRCLSAQLGEWIQELVGQRS